MAYPEASAPIRNSTQTIHALYHGPPHHRLLNHVYVASPPPARIPRGMFNGFQYPRRPMHTVRPARLTAIVRSRDIAPLVSGLYGEERASVSVWKQSVNACPNPYERKQAAKIENTRTGSEMSPNDIPAIPVMPETNRR